MIQHNMKHSYTHYPDNNYQDFASFASSFPFSFFFFYCWVILKEILDLKSFHPYMLGIYISKKMDISLHNVNVIITPN